MLRIEIKKFIFFIILSAICGSGIGYGKFWLFHVSIFTLFLVYILQFSISGKLVTLLHYPKSNFHILLIFFMLWNVASIIWSIEPIYAIRYNIYILFGLFIVIIITFYCVNKNRYLEVYSIVRFMATAAIFVGILEAFTPFRLPTSPYSEYAALFGRKGTDFGEFSIATASLIKSAPTSFWGNPNNFAVALSITMPFFWNAKRSIWKFAGVTAVLVLIVATGSRGAFFAVLFGFSIFLLMQNSLRTLIYIIFVAPIVLAGPSIIQAARDSNIDRLRELGFLNDALIQYFDGAGMEAGSIGARQELISNGMAAFWESNGLGVGAGGSQAVQEAAGRVAGKLTSMHNFWVEILVDGGVIGFGLFVALYCALCVNLLKIARAATNEFFRYNSRSLLLSLIIFAVACVSASSVIYFLPMWILIGLSIAFIGLWRIHRRAFMVRSHNIGEIA